MEPMKTLEIDRSKWLCGHVLKGSGRDSYLLDDDGMMCCLGFLGKACGGTDGQLKGQLVPNNVLDIAWPSTVVADEKDTPWAAVAVRVNDSTSLNDYDRECILCAHFRSIGYEVEFTGKYIDGKYNQA